MKRRSLPVDGEIIIKYYIYEKSEINTNLCNADMINSSIKNRNRDNIYYSLENGKILEIERENFLLYNNLRECNLVKRELSIMKPRHILYARNPYGEFFIDKVDQLIDDILRMLSIKDSSLSLREIILNFESSIKKKYIVDEFLEDYFINIVALIGKALLEYKKGRWVMKLAKDEITWYPFLEFHNGKNSKFLITLWEYIFDDSSKMFESIYSIYTFYVKD